MMKFVLLCLVVAGPLSCHLSPLGIAHSVNILPRAPQVIEDGAFLSWGNQPDVLYMYMA